MLLQCITFATELLGASGSFVDGLSDIFRPCAALCCLRKTEAPNALLQGFLRVDLCGLHGGCCALRVCASAAEFPEWCLLLATAFADLQCSADSGATPRSS
eukprot:Skav236722  [mRNA]  locus=scaffold2023:43449:46167:- [translate_table: standard]